MKARLVSLAPSHRWLAEPRDDGRMAELDRLIAAEGDQRAKRREPTIPRGEYKRRRLEELAAKMRAKYGNKPAPQCSVEGCNHAAHSGGMCSKHYHRLREGHEDFRVKPGLKFAKRSRTVNGRLDRLEAAMWGGRDA